MSLVEHLDELRTRLIHSAAALAAGMVICFILQGRLLDLLVSPLGETDKQLITLSPTEPFMTVLRVAVYCGLIIASPYIILQIWLFVAPALRRKEKRVLIVASLVTSLLFFAGVAFCWFFVLPRVLGFLLNYQKDFFDQQLQAAKYFSFASLFVLGFGLVFETPVIILTMNRLGIVDASMLRKNRKYAVLFGCIISAILTPQDVFSMLAMAVPFYFLYGVSIHMSALAERRRRKAAAGAEGDGSDVGEAAG